MSYKFDNIILNYSLSNVNLWLIAKIIFIFTKTKNNMRIVLSIATLFLISFSALAQKEVQNKSGELKLENYKLPTLDETPKVEEPQATLGYKSILSKKEDNYLKKFTFKKEDKVQPIMVQKDKGYDFDEDRKSALNDRLKEATTGNQTTQYLGEYTVETNLIKVMCRDHQEPDGDVVSILVNDEVVVQSVYLESGYKTFFLTLKEGTNHIDFKALNQGTSGPNTAAFVVFDEFGKQITSSQWNLNTGVKASLIIMNKAKETPEEKPSNTKEETTKEE